MAIVIIPPPTLAGGGDVTGGGDLNNANRVVIVAGTAEVGESDVSLSSGVFSRAGTVGLSATGANVITWSTNGSERGRWSSGGNLLIGTTTDDGSSKLQVFGNILASSAGATTVQIQADNAYKWTWRAETGSADLRLMRGSDYVASFLWGNGGLRLYNELAVTGVTAFTIRAGAGQSTGAMLNIFENDGTTSLLRVEPTKIGFFGAAPVAQQVEGAGDAAAIITALKNLGLMAP